MESSAPTTTVNRPPDEAMLGSSLKLRGDLRFSLAQQRGKPLYLVEDAVRSKYFHVGPVEFQFVRLLDGERSVAQALESANAQSSDDQLSSQQAVSVCQWLIQSNLVHCESPAMTQRLITQANQIQFSKRLSWLNPLFLRLPLFHPNNFIKRLTPWTSWLFSQWFLMIWLILAGVATHCIWENWQRVSDQSFGIFAPGRWLWMLLGWLALKLIHEMAHGVACKKFGGDVGSSGIQLILFAPLPYVDVTSSWRFKSRWQRIYVAAAGMYVELAITFLAIIAWVSQPTGVFSDLCYNIFVLSGLTTVLFNANPLMRFDGYYIFSDLVDLPNLYQRGQETLRRWKAWLFLGIGQPPQFESLRDAAVITGYGIASFFWRITLSLSILLAASTLFHGAGIAMAVLAAAMWYGPWLISVRKSFADPNRWAQISRKRLAVSAAVLGCIGLMATLFLTSSARKSAPCIVQFKDEQVLRAACDGFIAAIHVRDGQTITAGQLLVELDNQDLRLELTALESRAEQLSLKSRSFQASGHLADYQSIQNELIAVEQQLIEKREQVNQMQVRSPIDGFVDRAQIDNLINSFVKQGDPMAVVSSKSSKEVRVSIAQSDLESVKHNVGQLVSIVLPGVQTIKTNLSRLDPRASETPLHASLGACYGGPLAVKATANGSGKTDYELLSPCFSASIALDVDSSNLVHSGQRGIVLLQTSRESIGTNLYLRARRWVYRKLGWHVI